VPGIKTSQFSGARCGGKRIIIVVMRRFRFDKLVRDGIVQAIEEADNRPVYRILEMDDYVVELKKKLVEEVAEVSEAEGKDLVEELAEVMDALMNGVGISDEQIREARERKNAKRGAFEKREYVEYVEVDDDNEWVEYYLGSSEKYAEE